MEENQKNETEYTNNGFGLTKKPRQKPDKYINIGEFSTIFVGLVAFIICCLIHKIAIGLFFFGLSLVCGRFVGISFKKYILNKKHKQNG